MRSYDEYKRILMLWEEGLNKSEIERQTGIPRPTIRDCINKFETFAQLLAYISEHEKPLLLKILMGEVEGDHQAILTAYAYFLGLYLGDGNIVKMRRIYRLRITLDTKYPGIIRSCMEAGKTLLPDNQVGLVTRFKEGRASCVDVSIYHKDLPLFFPQHGAGEKHRRRIALETWQQHIIDTYPLEFFRGLYHSDGCRHRNIVNGKDYPRYEFTNRSNDIIRLFCNTCDRLDIHWTAKTRPCRDGRTNDVMISKRKDVAILDRLIGAKT
ncbi:MAG: hypothetical protein GC204_06315 [Chloroflexi bacterium]|nr:hypothetical protein [Chloroflexota bacterium]